MDSEDLARRLRAARALTPPTAAELAARVGERSAEPGISRYELAARINEPGLGEKVLGKLEREEKTPANRDLGAIAAALDLPLAFFVLGRDDLLTLLEQDLDLTLERWRRQGESRSAGAEPGSRSQGEG